MARSALSVRRVEGIGEGSLVGTFSLLLQLTGEAVLVFDGAGRILLANDEAAGLFGFERQLVGEDVRLLFPPAGGSAVMPGVGVVPGSAAAGGAPVGSGSSAAAGSPASAPSTPFSPLDLPFPLDGSVSFVSCLAAGGHLADVRVRCSLVNAPGETFLLVAIPADGEARASREEQRAINDLRRANHRLSGVLKIILDTLDSADMGALFERVLEEIADTVEADGTIVYLAESDGFHLRGCSAGLANEKIAHFMPFGRSVERLAIREGRAVRLRVCAPTNGDLRQGRLTTREVVNEETHEVLRMRRSLLPPFTSFISVPVWYGGHVIAIIEVGWRLLHPLNRDDAQLLDSVAHYLSVQLAGAFTTLRTQRADRLSSLGTRIRERLLAADAGAQDNEETARNFFEALREAADGLESTIAFVRMEPQGPPVVTLPSGHERELPVDLDALVAPYLDDGVGVAPVGPESELHAFLYELGEPCVGAFVDLGKLAGRRWSALLLRPDGSEPLDELELDFLRSFAADVRDIARGVLARVQDKRISQALQMGMRNELQDVEGITAQSVYSSATKDAFVGGDFYDLIRLPDRRACVIMGDVSGKGVEAASVSAAVKTALGAYAWEGLTPASMVRSLNDFLLGFSRVETFATLFVGVIDVGEGTLKYCSAGHPPAILIHSGEEELSFLDVQSGVVGAFKDLSYVDGTVELSPGDVLLLYTDGTTEARDPSGAFFGEDGLRELVMRECAPGKRFDGFVERLLDAVDAFTHQSLEDDMALLALRYDGLGEKDAGEKLGGAADGPAPAAADNSE